MMDGSPSKLLLEMMLALPMQSMFGGNIHPQGRWPKKVLSLSNALLISIEFGHTDSGWVVRFSSELIIQNRMFLQHLNEIWRIEDSFLVCLKQTTISRIFYI